MKEYIILCKNKKELDDVEKEAIKLGYEKFGDWFETDYPIIVVYLEEDNKSFNTYENVSYDDLKYNKGLITTQVFLGGKEKPYTHLVTWDIKDCGDPTEFFYSLNEAKEKATELSRDNDVVLSSIKIVEIKEMWEVVPNITINEVK